jgi:APA family basic amino acid/polyamine antiporter
MILLLSAVNIVGVRSSGAVQTVFTASKLVVLGLLVVLGFTLGEGSFEHLASTVASHPETGFISGLGVATISALWAYDGWNNLSMVSGEVENPQRNMPRALILGSILVIGVYALTNLAYFYVLTPAEIAGTSTVAADAARHFLGRAGGAFVAVGVMISAFATLNGSILAGSRIPFAQARDGLFPQALARVHPSFHTPVVAIIAQSVVASLLALTGQYEALFTKVIFAEWLFYMLVTAGIFILRRRQPGLERPYRTWGYPVVPAIFVVLAGLLLLNTFWERRIDSLWGLVMVGTGVPAYFLWKARKAKTAS